MYRQRAHPYCSRWVRFRNSRVRGSLLKMEIESRKEAGCQTYAFSVDVNDPGTLRIFERWDSMEALTAHFNTPHMAVFGAAIAEIQPKSMGVIVYEIAREVPLPTN